MAELFKDKLIKQKLENFEIPDLEGKIGILKNWYNLSENKTLISKKEEEIEGPFGDDIFGKVLEYQTITENDTYNRKFQPKVPEGGQKADIGLGFFSAEKDIMKVVVELKDAKTSLDKPQQRAGNLTPVQQAFKYKPYFKECDFIIVSNFYETRLYIDSYYDYETWTLTDLVNPKDNYFNFRRFYYLLSKNNLIAKRGESNTKSLLSLIRVQEKEITKQFYKEYTILRKELFKDIVKNNPGFKKTELDFLLNKTQKIIDRIIFIHFCEDLDLLPQGKLKEVIEFGEQSLSTVWQTLCNFFRAVDSGSDKLGIPDGYNGGLFHHDEELNALKVGDEICKKFVDMGEYDFADELSVNILGHIFEQSISDIEELKDKINKQEEATLSKRKKDGVFYTPEYIVDYIVKNSVGKKIDDWEEELKTQNNLKEDITDKNYTKRAIAVYNELQEKLQKITVLDPACGSGAFLVKVFDFLLDKNKEISKKLEELGVNQGLFSSESYFRTILKNNIYGVDLNEESVEITKLSLWLKTAQKGKKLANLDQNIKCGNSLIDDSAIAGDKAFSWETEFSQIFTDGGFDVIVGNPPYVRNEFMSQSEKKFYEAKFQTFSGKVDLYVLFMEQASNLINKKGEVGFIVPSKYTKTKYGKVLIKYLLKNNNITSFIDFKDLDVFEGIIAYPSIILFNKSNKNSEKISKLLVVSNDNYTEIQNQFASSLLVKQSELFDKLGSWNSNGVNEDLFELLKRLKNINPKLEDLNIKPQVGIKTGFNSAFIMNNEIIPENLLNNELLENYIIGRQVKRYNYIGEENIIISPYENIDGRLALIDAISDYPLISNFLEGEKDKLSQRAIIKQGIEKGTKKWYEFQQIKLDFDYSGEYIIYPDISSDVNFTFASDSLMDMTCFGIQSNSKSLLGILNSKLIKVILENTCVKARGGYLRLKNQYILNLPIPEKFENIELNSKVENILKLNKNLSLLSSKFLKNLKRNFPDKLDKLSNKLLDWYKYSFSDFVKELKKAKITLSLKDQDEWEEYFDEYKTEIVELKSKIDVCDREIDEMVFDLYGLSEEERDVVINS